MIKNNKIMGTIAKTEKYTKEERREIYLGAYERLAEIGEQFGADGKIWHMPQNMYGCHAMNNAAKGQEFGIGPDNDVVNANNFPEFYSFKESNNLCWLGNDTTDETCPNYRYGNEIRQTVMLLCAEMCE
jgi:hypothetical protein